MNYGQKLMIFLVLVIILLCTSAWVLAAFSIAPWFLSFIPLLLASVGAGVTINEARYYRHEDEGNVY